MPSDIVKNDPSGARRAKRIRDPGPGFRSSLRTRFRVSALVGIAILGAWLAYTASVVMALYDVALTIQRTTDLRERVQEARAGLEAAEESLDRYTSGGQGYDLSRHNSARASASLLSPP